MGINTEIALLILVGILLPTSSFGIQYFFSRIAGTHGYFLEHTRFYSADWLLIPFTVLALLTVNLRYVVTVIPVGLIVSYIAHTIWARSKYDKKGVLHFFTPDYRKLSHTGITHLIYTGFQIALVSVFIFTAPITPLVNYATLFLIFFAFAMLYSSFKMHKKILSSDITIAVVIFLFSVAKLYFQIPYTGF